MEFTIQPAIWGKLRAPIKRMFPNKTASFNYLLTTNTAKAVKGLKFGALNGIMYLAPAKTLSGQLNLCGSETPECFRACIANTGRNGLPDGQRARAARSILLLQSPAVFRQALMLEINRLQKRADRLELQLGIRLNGSSDIAWENFAGLNWIADISTLFPHAKLYDYTKHFGRCLERYRTAHAMQNYHLTFSWSGGNLSLCNRIAPDVNIAVPFAGAMPETFLDRPVITGDDHDMRYLDPSGVIVGLKYKLARRKQGGRMLRSVEVPNFVVQL